MFGSRKKSDGSESRGLGARRTAVGKAVATAVVATLLAGTAAPAFAGDRHHRHHHHGGWHGDRGWRGHGRTVVIERGWGGPRYYGHHRHHHHGGDAALLGLGAVAGLTAGVLLAQPRAPSYYAPPPVAYTPPPVAYGPPPAYGYDSGYESGYCREYQRNVHIGGRIQSSYGTACLQPDGSWRTVAEGP